MSWNEGVDIDGILMSCPRCGKAVYFGDFFHGKNKCIDCVDEEENLYVAQWNAGQSYPIKMYRV